MSAEFDEGEHIAEIYEAALKLAPSCTTGIDFTNYRRVGNEPTDCEKLADRAWEAGTAFVKKYHAEVEKASVKAAEEARRAKK